MQARKSLKLYIALYSRIKIIVLFSIVETLLKGIESLEKIQQRVTKFISSDYHSDYKSRLI